ncbi:MAG: SEC-C domain-containing protein [Longimicrobiaceae bacterium]
MTEEEWNNCVQLLNEAFSAYLELFWSEGGEAIHTMPEEWKRVRDVSLPAFLHYFNTGLLASSEQVISRIERYLMPFDRALARDFGISASDALRIAAWISEQLEENVHQMLVASRAEKDARETLLKKARSIDEARKLAQSSPYKEKMLAYLDSMNAVAEIRRNDLLSQFPETGVAFWDVFSVSRGAGPQLTYPTERSVADTRPLIQLTNEVAKCPSVNTLYTAILSSAEEALSKASERKSYFAHRDVTLESEAAAELKRIVGPSASVFQSVFETEDAQFEHDTVIVIDELALFVEVKATPPMEPFRDPERAFIRLKRAFKSDTGIQKAFEQAAQLSRRLDAGESVPLYDRHGQLLTTLQPGIVTNRFSVCVTRDNFGPLATNLALLLEKKPPDQYPWAVNIFDLHAIADAWSYLHWGKKELVDYLAFRIRAHGKVFGTDELEYAGFHISHGSLRSAVENTADLVQLNSHYSDFFDELYNHLHQGAPGPKRSVRAPVMMDLRESLKKGEPVFVGKTVSGKNRNQPCPCGSGRKYKNCCWEKGRSPVP